MTEIPFHSDNPPESVDAAPLSASDAANAGSTIRAACPPSEPIRNVLSLRWNTRPDGITIDVTSRAVLLDGKPWLPASGEFHYARTPASEWRRELLKMRAGGIDIVATYIFWIHHEEEHGVWNWTGSRDLRRFATHCAELGMPLVARIGPWAHGECRNGGFPDWLLATGCAVRSDDPAYLAHVKTLFDRISAQLSGLLWKDGGPVIAIQCENEFEGPAEHLLTIKRLAIEAGLQAPIYTYTGWAPPSTPLPAGQMLRLYGVYPEGFWSRELTDQIDSGAYTFTPSPVSTGAAMGVQHRSDDESGSNLETVPYCCCEIGGGMATSYHRRIDMGSADIEACAAVRIGSGCNWQGYYMYHGGTNPDGKFSTLQESQKTHYWNDLPVKSYDFHAPLGEFGQINPHYHGLRRLHLFTRDWGAELAMMPACFPERPADGNDGSAAPRWCARTDSSRGFVFVNNYHRRREMPAIPNVRFTLDLQHERLNLPLDPFTIPANCWFHWPFNMDLCGTRLVHATAQPICRITDGDVTTAIFGQTAGIPAEFLFEDSKASISSATGVSSEVGNGRILVSNIRPGTQAAVRIDKPGGRSVIVVVLTEELSRMIYKERLGGRDRVFLACSGLTADGDTLRLSSVDSDVLSVSILPAPLSLSCAARAVAETDDGVFRNYALPVVRQRIDAVVEPVKSAGPARIVPIGSQGVAQAPDDADFSEAGVWRIALPPEVDSNRDITLRVRYRGDVARVYSGSRLLTDSFYNGRPFDIALKQFGPEAYSSDLRLEILPIRADSPVYFEPDVRSSIDRTESSIELCGVDVLETVTVSLTV